MTTTCDYSLYLLSTSSKAFPLNCFQLSSFWVYPIYSAVLKNKVWRPYFFHKFDWTPFTIFKLQQPSYWLLVRFKNCFVCKPLYCFTVMKSVFLTSRCHSASFLLSPYRSTHTEWLMLELPFTTTSFSFIALLSLHSQN